MSTFPGLLRSFFLFAARPPEIESQCFREVKPFRKEPRFKAAELLVSLRVSLILPRFRSKRRRVIALSWSSMKFSPGHPQWTAWLSSIPFSKRPYQLEMFPGPIQRNPDGTFQPRPAKAAVDEGRRGQPTTGG